MKRLLVFWGLTVLMVVGMWAQETPTEPPELSPKDKQEVELGKKIVAEIEKEYKFVTDPEVVERVNRIGQTLAQIARSTPTPVRYGDGSSAQFEYTFRVIDDKEVNAFSVPGGFIFIYRGLLEFVSSDDELAGVIAHEIAHADHRHVTTLLRADAKVQQQVLLPALLVGLLGRLPAEDFSNMMTGAYLFRIARLSRFSQEAEVDADLTALEYLHRSPYNPVGLLVFMERLAAEERKRPQIDWGIFRTHPITRERVETLRKALSEYGIPIRRREVSPALQVKAVPMVKDQPDGLYRVEFGRIQIFTPADDPEYGSSKERAQQMASMLNRLLDDGLELYEVQLSPDRTSVLLRGEKAIRITHRDAELAQQTVEQLAMSTREAIRRLLWSDTLRQIF